MEPVIPCQDGQKELSDIMLTMEKYSMLKTQTREKKSKVIFHGLSLQLIKLARRVMGFEPCIDTFSRVRRSNTPKHNNIMVRKVIKDIKLLF